MTKSVVLRRPTVKDLSRIREIAKNYEFPLVDKFETAAVTTDENGKVIAFAVLRTNVEAILYCDGTLAEKIASVKTLIDQAKEDAENLGFSDILVFSEKPEFAELLKNKFNFREAKGIPLILDLK